MYACMIHSLTVLIFITFRPASPEVTPDDQLVDLDVDEESAAHSIRYHLIMLGITAIAAIVIL